MDDIKVEVDKDFENDCDSCFLCLLPFTPICQEESSLNLLFSYLKVEKVKLIVCEKCGEILRQFVNAWKIVEKGRLQMDYFLDCIRSTILNSNGSEAASQLNCVRKSVMKSCQQRIWKKPQILLQRIDPAKFIKKGEEPLSNIDYSDEWSPNWEDESNTSSSSESHSKSSPTKQIDERKRKLHPSWMPAKCLKCSKTFCKSSDLKRHINNVHLGLKPFKCLTCLKSFASAYYLRVHQRNIHIPKPHTLKTSTDKPFPCEICENTFATPLHLKWHKRIHLPAKFPCEFCNKMFKALCDVKRHISVAHLKQKHSCQVKDCNTTYPSRNQLVKHCKLKHPGKRDAPTNFKESYSERVENGESVFECKLCQKVFKEEAKIIKHIRLYTHAPEKYICEICGYKTRHTGHLKQHMARWHKTDDPVECNFCKKKVNTPLLLKIHVKNAHSEKKLQCQYCGYVTARKQHLNIHLKNVHKKLDVQ